jgi:hypothetical protein
MTAKTRILTSKKGLIAAFGVSMLAVPLMMPSTAKADDFKIHLNLGGAPYYTAPQRVVYVQEPRRVVYHSRPVYRERIVYRDYRGHKHHWHKGHDRGRDHGRGHGRHDRDYAWR